MQNIEDTDKYSGVISEGKIMGYMYTVVNEEDSFVWQIGYKEKITTIEESIKNKEELENFMTSISDIELILIDLIISLTYFLVVSIIVIFLYKKNRKILKEGAFIIVLACVIAFYISIDAALNLNIALADVKLHYLILTGTL